MSSFQEMQVINIRNRKILRSIADGAFFDNYDEMKDPLSALRFLSADGIPGIKYIGVRWKNRTTPIQVEITQEGSMLLEASDAFYGFLKKNKIKENRDSHKTLLTFEKQGILYVLSSKEMSHEDLAAAVDSNEDIGADIGELLANMENQGYISFNPETQTYSATEYGLIALEVTKIFYQRLTELGFFIENNLENGGENRYDDEPVSARDAFADFSVEGEYRYDGSRNIPAE